MISSNTAGRAPKALPIDNAPTKPGAHFGPCLVWRDESWDIGRWNGEEWADSDGWVISPIWWAPLPRMPVTIEHQA